MTHPLDGFAVQALGIKCFGENGSGFFRFSPVTIIIGKNNSGKSSVLDIVEALPSLGSGHVIKEAQKRSGDVSALELQLPFETNRLRGHFQENQRGGAISGNHWDFGQHFQLLKGTWRYENTAVKKLIAVESNDLKALGPEVTTRLTDCSAWSLEGVEVLRVAAERSVVPEKSEKRDPMPTGAGITNLIRHFIQSDSLPRDQVEIELLKDLNEIYSGDNHFTSIACQQNENTALWEIYLREDEKGDVRLSESGSSLQSIFLFLAYFRLVPITRQIAWDKLVLAVEEPENNLHPALLRKLINFLAEKRARLGFSLLLTTHSPICIDWANSRSDAGIIRVSREGNSSSCRNVMDYDEQVGILDDLDVKGSDILQANGVVWVEGPTERIYLKKWLSLVTDDSLRLGTHYTVMYYGGRVLSHFEANPESHISTLVSMVTVNRNVAIVMDSDRKRKAGSNRTPPMKLNDTKKRLRNEVQNRGGFSWVTAGTEIENYVPERVWTLVAGKHVDTTDPFVKIPKISAIESVPGGKVELAIQAAEHITIDDIKGHLDLEKQLHELANHIRRWNSLPLVEG